ncbi:MAG TPA: class I SAM-dependent rRNA methyltransferase [Bryobacteraceae bacterium]|nr:class I SAM-dependent rRNA methyltransferase [Bryobacteraceae bacterium]
MAIVKINRKATDRVASGHPWIFASDVVDRGDAQAGEAVQVADFRNRVLGTAHYSSTSQITLRFLSRRVEEIDSAFLRRRLGDALALRERVVHGSDAYRVVYTEGDLLPALIVDRYGDYLVIQTLNQGMDRLQPDIVRCLEELLAPKGIIARNDVAVRTREDLPVETKVVSGEVPGRVDVTVNGLKLHADLVHGQKTGVYLDQRENYVAAARYGRGTALDCFTSTGGFALHLARSCEHVEGVDSSEHAVRTAEANRDLNALGNVSFREADVFDLLTGYAATKRKFDLVVLDPPAFTKSRQAVEGAARGYKEINQRALRLLDSGGVLVTCSCSHHFSEAMLLDVLAQASLESGKTLRVLERRSQAQDHPILLTAPETHYLKCLVLQVV